MADKGGVNGTAVFVVVAGSILVWSGIKDKKVSAILQNLVAGQNPISDQTGVGTQDQQYALNNLLNPLPGTNPSPGITPQPQTKTAAQNQALARPYAAALGWTGQQWNDLVTLWNKESGWSNTAVNPTSGATGIPQALPATKLPVLGQAPSFDALTQIMWGLSYIKGRYGNPSNALAHEYAHNWY